MSAPSRNLIRYISLYGGFCRDCADTVIAPVCGGKGLPCGGPEHDRAIEHVLAAVAYGIEHKFIASEDEPDAVKIARTQARNAALEEAAKVADNAPWQTSGDRRRADAIAAAIRDLKNGEG